jgi:hypothetical protein
LDGFPPDRPRDARLSEQISLVAGIDKDMTLDVALSFWPHNAQGMDF